MEMMTNISKLTRQAGLAFAAVLWLGLNTPASPPLGPQTCLIPAPFNFIPVKLTVPQLQGSFIPTAELKKCKKAV